ncbi:hypothetical protein ERJ75_000212600 [Trypanosoma vivax]|uniref:Uncharacterized protein n=1 Tax=Trypanosoma vivax (strain Y486) TaxID=1055687 RepID=G0U9W7_TRYVY|nr:hypothetical protein TRVL_08417 [Trypanosoma vivax]KAH8619096.1 hypothetical protein ERJ75_000212600 [Trypanosoma vivax]CCC52598.1 conserved hypothetical protein [Trypanosoma vivax Y486]
MDVTDRVYILRESVHYKPAEVPHILMNVVFPASAQGSDTQFTCSEMLHWDEYREQLGTNDGTPKMMQLFHTKYEVPFLGYRFTTPKGKAEGNSVALTPALSGSEKQTYCSEMEHWDAYRRANNIQDGIKFMKELFYDMFTGHEMYVLNTNNKLLTLKSMCIVADRQSYGADSQMLCTEMLHWDDFQVAQGVTPDPKMGEVFGRR